LGLRRVCNNASLSEEAIATGERARRPRGDRREVREGVERGSLEIG
jgi:hypothetical protein